MAQKLVLILGALEGFLSQEPRNHEAQIPSANEPNPRSPLNGFPSPEIPVHQIRKLDVTPGSDVTLPCTYDVTGVEEATVGSYKWYRHLVGTGPEVSDSNKDFAGRISRADTEQFIKSRSAAITIHKVEETDAGTYFCEVSFLHGISGNGSGTLLNVTEGVLDLSPPGLAVSLGTVSGVVVVSLLVVGHYRICRRAPRSTVQA